MAAPTEEPEQRLDQEPAPHLSHSRIHRYLTCPEQYRLYYVEKLRPRVESASLVFGVVIHAALADLFRTGEDPVSTLSATGKTSRTSDCITRNAGRGMTSTRRER